MKRMAIVMLAATTMLVSACNTVRGVGQDVESLGNAVERTAD